MKQRKVGRMEKTALVTGGSRGIGRAICLELADMCGHLVINYGGNLEAAKETEARCKEKNPELDVILYQADISVQEEVEAMFRMVLERTGRVDILVNNAGITRDTLLISMKQAQFDEVIDVNLRGAFYCAQAAAKQMVRQRYGRIVQISSYTGVHGNAGQVNYAASKAGLIGMSKSMAKELAGRNVTVNVIAPGFIDTDMTAVLSEESKAAIYAQIPMKKTGSAGDVAFGVRFFVSDEAGYYTGQVLCPDGGMGM